MTVGSFTTVSSLYFSDSKAETTSNCTRPKKERMISWVMESTSQRKSGSVSASCVRASSSRSLCAAVFGAIVVRSMGRGSSRHLLRGCTSQQILDTNHKKIYNKKLSVSQISVRNATCDIELASDSLTNKLDAVH